MAGEKESRSEGEGGGKERANDCRKEGAWAIA